MYEDGDQGNRQRGQSRKTCWDCVKEDMKTFSLFDEQLRMLRLVIIGDWKSRGTPANPSLSGKWPLSLQIT